MMMNEREMRAAARRREMRRRKVMRNRCILTGFIFALILLIGGIVYIHNTGAAQNEVAEEETYIPQHEGLEFITFQHEVKSGESIGSIVTKLVQEYDSDESVDDVVNRVFLHNGLNPQEATYHLQPGDKIYVPMWAKVQHQYEEELN